MTKKDEDVKVISSFAEQDEIVRRKVNTGNGLLPTVAISAGKNALNQLTVEYEQLLILQVDQIVHLFNQIEQGKFEFEKGLTQIYELSHSIRGEAGMFDLRFLGRVAANLCLFIETLENTKSVDLNPRILKIIQIHLNSLKLSGNNITTGEITPDQIPLLDQLGELRQKFAQFINQ